ncbi:hypothetical protein [Bacillus salipaludis]|uniref:Uncharacterized protein n=1 Tax=Bacillus salipaludis TaxID=2547811 RepID=A0ABW8RIQ9_9BACI
MKNTFCEQPLILLKYKTLKSDKLPNKIVLPSSPMIYVNSNENRGRALLNKGQITIINALASDKNDVQKEFYIDQHWSDTSSASYLPSHNMIEKVPVSAMFSARLFVNISFIHKYNFVSYELCKIHIVEND